MSVSKKFVFTLNNYKEFPELQDHMQYLTYGKEVGESGTPHLQGFVYYKASQRVARVIKDIPGAHIEIAKGTFIQAIEYCHKDGDFIEFGDRPKTQLQKGDAEKERWELALSAYKAGDFDHVPADIGIRYGRGLAHWASVTSKTVLVDTEEKHLWYWGKSGTGKSRKAREDHPGAYLKMCNKWWDGYNGQETVIIEDFDGKHEALCHHLKIWADRYPFPAEQKGSKVDIRPKLIIVTSNYHPKDIWFTDSELEPILRRFKCEEFKKLGV